MEDEKPQVPKFPAASDAVIAACVQVAGVKWAANRGGEANDLTARRVVDFAVILANEVEARRPPKVGRPPKD